MIGNKLLFSLISVAGVIALVVFLGWTYNNAIKRAQRLEIENAQYQESYAEQQLTLEHERAEYERVNSLLTQALRDKSRITKEYSALKSSAKTQIEATDDGKKWLDTRMPDAAISVLKQANRQDAND